jgi:hypothetical protein
MIWTFLPASKINPPISNLAQLKFGRNHEKPSTGFIFKNNFSTLYHMQLNLNIPFPSSPTHKQLGLMGLQPIFDC